MTEKWYLYRRKDGMDIRRNRWSPWLILKGYRLMEVVKIQAWDAQKDKFSVRRSWPWKLKSLMMDPLKL